MIACGLFLGKLSLLETRDSLLINFGNIDVILIDRVLFFSLQTTEDTLHGEDDISIVLK